MTYPASMTGMTKKGMPMAFRFVLFDLPGEYDGYDEEGDAHGLQVLGVLLVKGFQHVHPVWVHLQE
jgi:hypothetical protein